MKSLRLAFTALLLLGIVTLLCSTAGAQVVSLQFTPGSTQTGLPGDVLTYSAIIRNNTSSPILLQGLGLNLITDQPIFLTDLFSSFTLNGNQEVAQDLFLAEIDTGAASSLSFGTADLLDEAGQVVGSADFWVGVSLSSQAAPEATSIILLGCGLLVLWLALRRVRAID